jgi:hypothetical protein
VAPSVKSSVPVPSWNRVGRMPSETLGSPVMALDRSKAYFLESDASL